MTINKVTFNSVNFWDELGAALTAPVAYPIPAEIKENIKIKGMSGSLTEATGYFNDLEIELNFKALIGKGSAPEARKFNTLKRKINLIFNNINDTKLIFSDIPNRCYKIKSCVVGSVSKISDYELEFDVEFTCDPFLYKISDTPETQTGTTSYNGDIPNKPIITFSVLSSQQVDLICNGDKLSFEAEEGTVEINKNPYSVVTNNGKPIKSVGNAPIFTTGANTISIQGPVFSNLQIIKNERYLG